MKFNVLLILSFVLVAGCIDQPCDPDQDFRDGVCYDRAAPVADAGPSDASAVTSAFGAACVTSDNCPAGTDFCAISPGAAAGYCTHTGCLADPTICPVSWGCLDLSTYSPGLPAICTEPPTP